LSREIAEKDDLDMDIDVVQLGFIAFCTGMGTSFGTELAKYVFQKLRERLGRVG